MPATNKYIQRLRCLDSRHASGSSYLFQSGSIFSIRLRLDNLVGSPSLKNFGASSTSHFGSIIIISRMYSFVVSTSS